MARVHMHRPRTQQRVLAISSGGGHWIQLLRLRPAFAGSKLRFASVYAEKPSDIGDIPYSSFTDANRDTKIRLVFMALKILWILICFRPHCVVSTGAACGYLACRMGRWFGARTLFIDSLANAEQLSLSARLAKAHATQVYSQWQTVAKGEQVGHHGSVL